MSKNKSDLVMAYAVKRKSSKPTVIEAPQADAELSEIAENYGDEEDLWTDMPDEEPEAKETPEARVARIMQNFRLSNLGSKSED